MAEVVYNRAKASPPANGASCGMLLLKATAAGASNPDLNTVADLLAVGSVAEADFTNYARKTFTITVAEDDTNNRGNFDAPNQTWSSAGGAVNNTPVAAVIYVDGANDAARNLVTYHDTGFNVATNGADYSVNINDFMRIT